MCGETKSITEQIVRPVRFSRLINKKILVIDNYDSFTYNLVTQLKILIGSESAVEVLQNDSISPEEILWDEIGALVISPGPGGPDSGGISLRCLSIAERLSLPTLGVCLGQQLMAFFSGASIVRAKFPIHGKGWDIFHTGDLLFRSISNPFIAARYHSLVIDKKTINAPLVVIASTTDGEIMAIRHEKLPWYGVQFHPESFLTVEGEVIVRNFLQIADLWYSSE